MLLLFYGQDGYRSFQKLQELKKKYVDASLGDTNLTTIDVTAIKPDDLAAQLFAFPFLAKTRLVVLPDLLSNGPKAVQEKFESLITKIPSTTVAVVYESGVPDRRTTLFKLLKKEATVQEFAPLMGAQLNAWISQLLGEWEVRITPLAREQLVGITGADTWRLATELRKLATALLHLPSAERQITPQLVTDMVVGAPEVSVFALTDALLAGNQAQTIAQLKRVVDQGENEQYLIAMVASALRSLALIRESLDGGASSQAAVAAATGLKPFVVGKQLAAARRLTMRQVSELYTGLVALDAGLKSGTMQSEIGLELYLMRTATLLAAR